MKTCTKCGETKPLSEFSRDAHTKDGRVFECKICASARSRAYRQANREKLAAQRAEWYQANREKRAAYFAVYQQANREKLAVYHAEWYQANREKHAAYSAAYSQANPHCKWESRYRHRCLKFGVTPVIGSFTREDLVAQYGDGCWYCDDGAFEELDHYIPIAAGGEHTLDNVRPSCQSCNLHKSKATDRVLVSVYRTVAVAVADHFAQLTHLEP